MYIFVSFLGCFVVVTVVVAVVVGSSGFYRVSECEPKRCRFDSIEIEKSLVNVWYFRIIFFFIVVYWKRNGSFDLAANQDYCGRIGLPQIGLGSGLGRTRKVFFLGHSRLIPFYCLIIDGIKVINKREKLDCYLKSLPPQDP